MIWIMSLVMSIALANAAPKKSKGKAKAKQKTVDVNMTKVGTCAPELPAPNFGDQTGEIASAAGMPKPEVKTVMVFKQWHLAPTTVTKGFKEKYQQEKNQTAIYKKLSEMVKKQMLQVVVAEGCEGEIDGNFEPAFNGWKIKELEKQAQTKGFDKIITMVPMKLEARWGDKLVTLCGDDLKLIKESQMHLSNLRGWMGFWTRLNEAKPGDDKLKLYADAAADLLKMPKDTPVEELKKKINERSVEELQLFEQSLNDRNAAFVKAVQSRDYTNAAIVIGGLHAADLKSKLEKAGLNCNIYEPPGYSKQDETLIQDFAKSLKN